MLTKIIEMFFLLIILIVSFKLSQYLIKNYKINRWIIACISPLIILIPSFLFNHINQVIWNVLIAIFCFSCILFFELTNAYYENKKLTYGKKNIYRK